GGRDLLAGHGPRRPAVEEQRVDRVVGLAAVGSPEHDGSPFSWVGAYGIVAGTLRVPLASGTRSVPATITAATRVYHNGAEADPVRGPPLLTLQDGTACRYKTPDNPDGLANLPGLRVLRFSPTTPRPRRTECRHPYRKATPRAATGS